MERSASSEVSACPSGKPAWRRRALQGSLFPTSNHTVPKPQPQTQEGRLASPQLSSEGGKKEKKEEPLLLLNTEKSEKS